MAGYPMKHIVVGMAGHIDHGKTSIVKALTGIDTDRLKEEKERGMTTDLGFAFLGNDIAIIDVPGHEKFVKTMVAGVNAVDLALLVIAADDGIMPQTLEHFEILRLLQVPAGLVVLNKIDLVDKDWLEMVTGEIRKLLKGTFLEGAPIITVSAETGQGIAELQDVIRRAAASVRERKDKGIFRMPIDRVFTISGFGTVVAGTILSGTVRLEDAVELLPHGRVLRVRGIQIHENNVTESTCGLRTAINLHGVEKELIERGNVLGAPGFYKPTYMVDAHFKYLETAAADLQNRVRLRVHLGTSEVIARVILLDKENLRPGDEGFVQIHFEKSVVADVGDRYVARSYSPIQTLGGGAILDVHPVKHKRLQQDVCRHLERILAGDPKQLVLEHIVKFGDAAVQTANLAKLVGMPADVCTLHLQALERERQVFRFHNDLWFASVNLLAVKKMISEVLERFHIENRLRIGISTVDLHSRLKPPVERKLFDEVCKVLQSEGTIQVKGDKVALFGYAVHMSGDQLRKKEKIEELFHRSPLTPPDAGSVIAGIGSEADKILLLMIETGELIRLEEGILVHRDAIELAKQQVAAFLGKKPEATLSEIRQHLGITRKYALPILVYLDSIGLTERDGDIRRLKRR